jgi:hypothetical protein
MRGNIELNIIAAGWVLGLVGILVPVAMLTSLSPTQMISAQIIPADSIKAMDTTVPSDTGISREGNQSSSGIPAGTPNNATLANSSSIIQSAVLPPQLPITSVSSTSNIDDDDDDSDDGNDDDDRTRSNDDDDDSDDGNDDDRTSSSVDDDDNDDSDRRSIIIQGGGVSVSVG